MINEGIVHVRTKEEQRAYRRRVIRRNVIGTLMAAPPFIGFVLFGLIPMAVSLWISFTDLHTTMIEYATPTGLRNYIRVFKDPLTLLAFENSLVYCLSVPINLGTSLFLANILYSRKVFGDKVLRILFFLPQVCAGTAVTLMFSWILNEDFGMVNTVLRQMNLPTFHPYTNADHFLPGVLLISLWKDGMYIVLLQSALNNVNVSLQEAARIDGASEMQVFWKITFPGISPTLFYQFTMGFIAAAQEMSVMNILTGGGTGPGYKALTVSYYLYRMVGNAWVHTYGYGMSCAMSWVFAVVVIIITRVSFKISDKWVKYE